MVRGEGFGTLADARSLEAVRRERGPTVSIRTFGTIRPVTGWTVRGSAETGKGLRVLRISHSAVVTAWRRRERELRAAGAEVCLLSAARWEEGGSLVPLEAAGDDFVEPVRTLGRHPNLFAYDPRPIWRALGQAWDVLDLHEEPFSVAAAEVLLLRRLRRQHAPYVLYSAQNLDKRYPPPFRWFERWSLRGAAGAYTTSADAAGILRRKGLLGPAVVIPLGVDVDRFSPVEREPPVGRLRVGFVGRLIPHKGVDVLLDAVSRDPRLSLEVVGAGSESAQLVELAAALGVSGRVVFRGHLGEEATPDVYRTFDVLAVPSVPMAGWIEQFGRVVVEAQASGVPVVASRSGALPDVVGEAGLVVEPGDPRKLSEALVAYLDEPGRWARDRAAGLEAASRCGWDRVAADQLELYRSAVGGR